MNDYANEILNILNNYFQYLYPGFISLEVFYFIKAKKLDETKNTIIKSIVLSYIYVSIINCIKLDANVKNIVLLIIAIIVPYAFVKISMIQILYSFFKKIGIYTNIYNNPIDVIRNNETDMTKGICLKVFMDNIGIMYEGFLRNYQSDVDENKYICLSGYRVYKKRNNSFELFKDNDSKHEHWVVLKYEHIDRIEIVYSEEK